jgi:uncharacterized protein with HEPN domain
MSRHDELIRLRHMLDAAKKAVELARGQTARSLADDEIRELALERLFEILGEAASQTTPEIRLRFPEIPWSRAVGMRNEIIHGYATVDLDVVLRTIERELPALIAQLEKALSS